jgi:hypothetical protein
VSTPPAPGLPPVIARLRALRGSRPEPATGERCELCAVGVGPEHPHLVHLEQRALLCVCRPCYLLFAGTGASQSRYRAVPERRLFAPGLRLSEGQWEALQIPVNIAFFFHNSSLGKAVAFYPSPAGATESLLPLAPWEEVVQANLILQALEPDVEAFLVYRRPTGFECYVVGIDACYELVGRIRRRWKGFDGGTEAWHDIDLFFADLKNRSTVVPGSRAELPWPS